ncbi:hypothetical protein GFB49_11135 [Epibacterium sp. SM1979]|uniref:Roadblock/LAMTOR2 domain-containing protein n=1 Tax=Tritonibacter litoralis TaxID=2662264 RepID=A0A843YIN7_9RHOB|nr:hypothetical protein [Tritonibacter litoralis]MQQ09009.1 hypothetical protein [Tritonibacter litoralis]
MTTRPPSSPAPVSGALGPLAEALTALEQSAEGCRLAGFGDLGARLVLRAEPAGARPQEALDDLCVQAAEAYALADRLADQLAENLVENLGSPVRASDPVMAWVPGETRLFLRAEQSDDAVFLACDRLDTAQDLVAAARDVLQAVAPDGAEG